MGGVHKEYAHATTKMPAPMVGPSRTPQNDAKMTKLIATCPDNDCNLAVSHMGDKGHWGSLGLVGFNRSKSGPEHTPPSQHR